MQSVFGWNVRCRRWLIIMHGMRRRAILVQYWGVGFDFLHSLPAWNLHCVGSRYGLPELPRGNVPLYVRCFVLHLLCQLRLGVLLKSGGKRLPCMLCRPILRCGGDRVLQLPVWDVHCSHQHHSVCNLPSGVVLRDDGLDCGNSLLSSWSVCGRRSERVLTLFSRNIRGQRRHHGLRQLCGWIVLREYGPFDEYR